MAANPVVPAARTDAEQQIRALAKEYQDHSNRRDAQKVTSLFVADGVMNPLYAPAAEGHEAIRKALEHDYQTLDPKNLVIETAHVETTGDVGFSYGTYTMNVRTPDGERFDDRGKWVTGCRRENGRWRVVANCWNTDLNLFE